MLSDGHQQLSLSFEQTAKALEDIKKVEARRVPSAKVMVKEIAPSPSTIFYSESTTVILVTTLIVVSVSEDFLNVGETSRLYVTLSLIKSLVRTPASAEVMQRAAPKAIVYFIWRCRLF